MFDVVYLVDSAMLHQTPAQQFAAVGDLVETFCSSSACVVDTDLLRWFMKKDSEVIALNTSCKAGPGCRVTTRGASNGDCGLTIRDVQPVDSGVYYCAEYSSNALEFSNGSLLIVRDSFMENASVSILVPVAPASALDSERTLTLVCLARGFSSPLIRFQWFISGSLTAAPAPHSGIKETGGGGESYSATSRLTIPAETWQSGAVCACGAQLNSSTVIRSREISYTAGESCHVYYGTIARVALVSALPAFLLGFTCFSICSKKEETADSSTRRAENPKSGRKQRKL
ncbi:T cell receptor beta chain MC.7.G5-like [Acipenser ruthenus]|uniref:T cell receptor beta chain MC.7.G5-like n=1 Tax=Acipenser ruthenus TaxID=7906 RepID=UPI00274087B8|nr:T cell receptor beta chain MC.7.G5-like [Acipenser ruthenus]